VGAAAARALWAPLKRTGKKKIKRINRADVFNAAGIRRSDPVKPAAARVFLCPAVRPTARPGPSAAAAAAFPLRRGTLSRRTPRRTLPDGAAGISVVVVLILYRTAGARPAGTGDGSPSPFSLGSR